MGSSTTCAREPGGRLFIMNESMERGLGLHVELSTDERRVLSQLLEEALPKLDVEIHRTDKLEFKEALVRRRHILTQLLAKTADGN